MKNFKLLLTTTAILSTAVAIGANAVITGDIYTALSNAATINMDVEFVHSLQISEDTHLNFGILLNPVAGQNVEISSIHDTPILHNGATLAFTSGSNVPHRGRLHVLPSYAGSTDARTAPDGYHYDIVFEESSIDLVNGDETCGKVTGLYTDLGNSFNPDAEGSIYFYYGALFTVDESMTSSHKFTGKCTGSTTATLVLVDNTRPSGS